MEFRSIFERSACRTVDSFHPMKRGPQWVLLRGSLKNHLDVGRPRGSCVSAWATLSALLPTAVDTSSSRFSWAVACPRPWWTGPAPTSPLPVDWPRPHQPPPCGLAPPAPAPSLCRHQFWCLKVYSLLSPWAEARMSCVPSCPYGRAPVRRQLGYHVNRDSRWKPGSRPRLLFWPLSPLALSPETPVLPTLGLHQALGL